MAREIPQAKEAAGIGHGVIALSPDYAGPAFSSLLPITLWRAYSLKTVPICAIGNTLLA